MKFKLSEFKPGKIPSLYILFLFLLFLIPFWIWACFDPHKMLIPVILIFLSFIAIYAILRISYRIKYIIDDEYITAYKGKKSFFKIKKSDIECVYVKKGHWYDILIFIFMTIFEQAIYVECCSSISFIFKNCEEIITINRDGFDRISLCPKEKSNFYEMPEYFSYNQCKKICELLEIEPMIVKKYDHYKERVYYSDDI